ncbi:MAG TPA: ribosome biogenesis GTPase Der [Thermodesulfobacteriota bacterium]|nr:ribosome biogenesis GTPase Der [Thermodesulfobacteriota bacterium]
MTKTNEHLLKRKPIVAIVGRPNVGKSTLFNRLIGWQKAIVEDVPGVTRDRLYGDVVWEGIEFSLVDTGGFEPESEELYPSLIKSQIDMAIKEADLILFVLDGKTGVMPQDIEISRLLRKTEKPVIYTINKVDHEKHEIGTVDFHRLGAERFQMVSALHGRRIDELLDVIVESLPHTGPSTKEREGDWIKVAVVGKPNVGKSTLINRILGEERLLTSPVPGTTRDSVDTPLYRDGNRYVFIDTAGIRRRSKVTFSVERYSVLRAIKTIERADIVLLMIDAKEGPTHQDARLADLIQDRGKGCIVLVNKWDLVPKRIADTKGVEETVRNRLRAIDFAPVIPISALTGKGVDRIFECIDLVYGNYSRKIPTKPLNKTLEGIIKTNPPPIYKGTEIKFYYITQPMTKPPTFVLFTNRIRGIPESYKGFLENRLRDGFKLEGTPIRFIFRARRKKKRDS